MVADAELDVDVDVAVELLAAVPFRELVIVEVFPPPARSVTVSLELVIVTVDDDDKELLEPVPDDVLPVWVPDVEEEVSVDDVSTVIVVE